MFIFLSPPPIVSLLESQTCPTFKLTSLCQHSLKLSSNSSLQVYLPILAAVSACMSQSSVAHCWVLPVRQRVTFAFSVASPCLPAWLFSLHIPFLFCFVPGLLLYTILLIFPFWFLLTCLMYICFLFSVAMGIIIWTFLTHYKWFKII